MPDTLAGPTTRTPLLLLSLLLVFTLVPVARAYDVVQDIPYSITHPKLVFDWYRPAGVGPHPVVIYIHGAHLAQGDKSDVRTDNEKHLLDMLLANGVTVMAINVRPFPQYIYPAQLEDAALAVQFIRSKAAPYSIDPSRLAVWGQSGGAVIGGWLAYGDDFADPQGTPFAQISSRPQAFINSVALTNWLILHPALPGWMFGKNTLGEVSSLQLKDASISEQVVNVTRAFTPPVASMYPGPEGTPPLIDVHDTTMMKVLHANLALGYPAVAAQSLELTRTDIPQVGVRQELVAAWTFELFGLPSQVIELGHATAGTNGAPALTASGSFTAGGAFTLDMQAAVTANTMLWVVTGETRANLPLFGGTLLPDPKIVVVFPSDANGHVTLAATVPAMAPPGHEQYLQFWHADPAGPEGWAASNGLKFVLQ